MMASPKIDTRTREDILNQAKALLLYHVPLSGQSLVEKWPVGDPLVALVEIFSRYMEIAIERLNRAPEKNFLAFLDMIGTSLLPAKAAKVPVQFFLATGAKTEGLVPSGTPIASTGTAPIIFETEHDLVVTPSKIDCIIVHDPGSDMYDIYGYTDEFAAFSASTLIEHSLSLGDDMLFRINHPTDVTVQFKFDDLVDDPFPLLNSLRWYAGETLLAQEHINVSPRALPPGPLPSTVEVTVKLSGIGAIEPQTIANQESHWLTVRTSQPLGVGREVPIVTFTGIKTRLATSIAPDATLAGNVPVDVTKTTFYPFGEKPRINDAFYIGSDEVFSRKGATVTLTFGFTKAEGNNPMLNWEYWNGLEKTWTTFDSVVDRTTNFTADPSRQENQQVTFTIPHNLDRVAMGDRRLYGIRLRLASGDYGKEAHLKKEGTENTLADYRYTEATFSPPSIHSLLLTYAYQAYKSPERVAILNNFSSSMTSGPFPMFVPPRADDATAFYIGFDRPLANRMISLYLPVIEQEDPQKSSTVAWEFWNGTEWMALGARDETHDLTQPGMVQFLGPQDFQAKKEFDVLRYWVRARLAQIQQEEKGSKDQGQSKKAKEKLKLAGIIPNAVWARQGVTIEGEALGTSTGKPDQVFSFSHTPILEGEELEVREPERPSPRQLDELKREAGFDPLNHDGSTPTGGSEIWVRWQPVEHFYLSHPESRHYVLERRMGELRFGNGMQGKIPPAGRDNIRLRRYRVGGGKAANVAAGRITILKRAIPLIAGVNNPYPATAGADGERTEEVMRRGPLRLKHLDRAVTSEDYEWLAREASVQVARARCPLVREESHAGQVAVLIVPDETEAQPFPGPGLRRMVADYIAPRCPAGVVLSVLGPTYVEVSVKASVAPARLEEGDLVRQRILQGLSEFLHPLRGGPDQRGWPFGRDAYLSEVLAFIERIDGVDYVKEAELTGRIALEGLVHTGGVERNVLIGKEARFKSLVPGDQLWLDDTLAYLITKVDSETMPPSVRIDRPVTIAEQHARPLRVTRAISVGATFKSAGGDGSVLQVINAKHAETLYDLMPGDHVWIASIANSHKARTVTGIDVVMGTVTVNPPTELAEGQSTTVALVGGGNRRAQANDDVGELVAAGRHFITIVPSAT